MSTKREIRFAAPAGGAGHEVHMGGGWLYGHDGLDREHSPFYRKRWPLMAAFLYLWATVGFCTGTGVLVGPARWITGALQGAGMSQGVQDHAMQATILLFVLGSAALSLWLLRVVLHGGRRLRIGIPVAVTLAAVLSLWAWMNPGRMLAAMAGGGDAGELATAGGADFVFGAYPGRDQLEKMKKEGFTAVISLQHPAVVPFEPASIEEEKRSAAAVGLEFIHAPMLPWVSDNTASLEKIRQIAHSGHGKYYVHCGLGRDRTNVVKRMLEADGVRTTASATITHASTLADRLKLPVGRGRDFQRGAVRELEPGVWLVPFPNPAEMAGYLEAGQVKQVVLLLDPADARQKEWTDQALRDLAATAVPTALKPLPASDLAKAQEIAAWVRTLPRPVAVIAPRTPFSNGDRYRGTEAAVAFARAYAAAAAPAQAPAR